MNQEITSLLKEEFNKKKLLNNCYSLRAFARDIDLSPAYLSLILNGKSSVSKSKAAHIINKLLSGKQKQIWLKQLESLDKRFFHKGSISEYKKIHCNIKLTWSHYAILEAFNLKDFRDDPAWINEKLGIGIERIQEILLELLNIGAIEKKNNQLVTCERSFTNINDQSTSNDRKEMQKEILSKSLEAINTVDINKRNHTSMTIAVDSSVVIKMKERIRDFQRELCNEASSLSNRNENSIYQLQIALFPTASSQ